MWPIADTVVSRELIDCMKVALSRKNIWDKTPTWLKSTVGRSCSLVPPAWFLGRKFRDNCRFVTQAQWWPADRARQYQLARLRDILRLAYEKTAFYRRTFNAVGFRPGDLKALADMRHLPTIDKQVVNDHLAEMCTRCVSGGDVDMGSTGGTSGAPLRFYLDAHRSFVEYAYLTSGWTRVGYRLGMPMAVLRGRRVGIDRNGLRHEYDPILRHHFYSSFHMTAEHMTSYVEHMRTIGVCVLHAYPSSAHALARHLLATATPAPRNVKAVLLQSENVYSDQIEDIETAFRARVFSSYGHSEKLVLADQCEDTRDYHVWPTYGYCELLDEEGSFVTVPGQRGEIVGTGFINTIVPFIRYRTGDWATYGGAACAACGREHAILTEIRGRWPQGELLAADGSIITTTALNVHDDTFRKVQDYQFQQSVPGKATLWIVPSAPIDAQERRRIVAHLNKRLQGQVVFDIELRTELIQTSRGKQPRVVRTGRGLAETWPDGRTKAACEGRMDS